MNQIITEEQVANRVALPPPINIEASINASFARLAQSNIEQQINSSFNNIAQVPNIEQNISRSIQENIDRQLAGATDRATGVPVTTDYADILETVGRSKKVKLMQLFSFDTSTGNATKAPTVLFDVTPELTETQNVSYTPVGDIYQAAEIIFYSGSQSRTFNLSAKFVSRTVVEARNNIRRINRLKSWTKPDKRQRTTLGDDSGSFPSGTPAVLSLFGYGERLNGITVVIENLTITYPDDVDYITAFAEANDKQTSIPIICQVTVGLKEVHSPEDIKQFDIVKYRQGNLPGW